MILEPDFELLESIGIGNDFLKLNGYKLEVEETAFESLKPFLIRWGGGEALQELFFFQLNFINESKPVSTSVLNLFNSQREFFESRTKLEEMDFEELESITLHFGNGKKANLPSDLLEWIANLVKSELESEKPENVLAIEKLKEWKILEKNWRNSKKKILEALPKVEAIMKAKFQGSNITDKQIMLCTYGLFYQRGHRLKFEDHTGTEPESLEDNFLHVTVYDNIRRK